MPRTHDSYRRHTLSPSQLRLGGTLLAALAGAVVGLMLGMTLRLLQAGDQDLAIVTAALSIIVALALGFLVLHARVLADLVESGTFYSHAAFHDLDRRLDAIETELAVVQDRQHGLTPGPVEPRDHGVAAGTPPPPPAGGVDV